MCQEVYIEAIIKFSVCAFETPWDQLHATYFCSYALWTYLTIPFLYTYSGFSVEEISPWNETGEKWRRSKATFPDCVTSHTKEQVSYFGPEDAVAQMLHWLIRREAPESLVNLAEYLADS